MRRRGGVTLVPVIALLGATLLMAVAFVNRAHLGDRATRLAWQGERALHAADAALLDALAGWPVDTAHALRPGEEEALPHRALPDLATAVTRTRLSAARYLVRAHARHHAGASGAGIASRDDAARALQRVVRLEWPRPPGAAALVVVGRLTLRDSATVIGVDTEPFGWSALCASDRRGRALPAIYADAIAADASTVIVGEVPTVRVPSATERAQLVAQFETAFTALAARASRTTGDSVLDLDLPERGCRRWVGDARRDASVPERCARQWPILHATHGEATEVRGALPGQGVLLVEGDLVVVGGVQLHGVVLVRGRVRVDRAPGASPTELTGVVIVRDQDARGSELAGARVLAGQCAVRFALASAGVPLPERRLGWHVRP